MLLLARNPGADSPPGMSTQEFYIRGENDAEARGPFTHDQLASLVEARQLDANTLYYDAAVEQWVTVGSNASLMAFLFPEKKKLKVKPKDEVATLNAPTDADVPIRVEDMLAAAEGRTAETYGRGDPKIGQARIAGYGRYFVTAMMLFSIFGLLFPPENLTPLYALEWKTIGTNPYIIFGLIDVFFGIVLLLGATAFYPALRVRLLIGLGFFGLLFYLQGDTVLAIAILCGSVGAYLSTIALNWPLLIVSGVVGLLGSLGFAYLRVMV